MISVFDTTNKPIALGSDHAGYEYKEAVKNYLIGEGFNIRDFGPFGTASVDYPDFAHPVATAVEHAEVAFGILFCGSANGVAITANKHPGIRAGLCWEKEVSSLVRRHNDANILCIPARFVTIPQAIEMVAVFIETPFEGGRHGVRVGKISCQ